MPYSTFLEADKDNSDDGESNIMTELAISIRLDMPFAETVDATREALSEQGFGILTEIDMQSTLKAKIDADIERYVILGACNPRLAKSAIDTDRQVGLLLPCNVIVRADGGSTIVEAMNPQVMVGLSDAPGLADVADEATALLHAAIMALSGESSST
ncbi:ABC transporter (plasmid) [Rhodococcus erythropolis]|uniref:ABC transporter n=2 Tax=Rhodococcus erythropolis TaxID=1833 RepID=A0A6G9D3A6_RHOER|nr:ABC transporter [Rhodococcus erythropolis DN1]QIP43775.1 ABC transporter [Rhodococcus erythropolis]